LCAYLSPSYCRSSSLPVVLSVEFPACLPAFLSSHGHSCCPPACVSVLVIRLSRPLLFDLGKSRAIGERGLPLTSVFKRKKEQRVTERENMQTFGIFGQSRRVSRAVCLACRSVWSLEGKKTCIQRKLGEDRQVTWQSEFLQALPFFFISEAYDGGWIWT